MVLKIAYSLLLFIAITHGYVRDLVLKDNVPRDCECAVWTSGGHEAFWANDSARRGAANFCAMPAKAVTPDSSLPEYSPEDGWCYCKNDTKYAYTFCDPPINVPSQVNLLAVDAATVVVNFVTNDQGCTADWNVEAMLRPIGTPINVTAYRDGISTLYKDSTSSRMLSYHSVTLRSLVPRTSYEYKVRAFASNGSTEWSDWISFKSLYSEGPTRFAIYADMGVFASQFASPPIPATARHNVGNLLADWEAGAIDFAIHSGDHAYEFEVDGGSRGDGYMDSYSQFIAHAPWLPGWGNHEYLESDRGNRLANITMLSVLERRRASVGTPSFDQHRMHYSANIGLLHLVHLDFSPYWCRFDGCVDTDTCGFPDEYVKNATSQDPDIRYDFDAYRERIKSFLRSDLRSVNRSSTPWIVVTAHYPFYETYDDASPKNRERESRSKDFGARGRSAEDAATPSKALAIQDFETTFREFGVDIYFAGHDHNYETTWPVFDGKVQQTSFDNPNATVHILAGAAGPPEWDLFHHDPPTWSREPRLLLNSYAQVYIKDAHELEFRLVANDNGTVFDSFSIRK